jgi:hypothetical protein
VQRCMPTRSCIATKRLFDVNTPDRDIEDR